jgi:hypothetical protein
MHTAILAECPICQKKQAIRKPLEAAVTPRKPGHPGANPNCKRSVPSHLGCMAGLDSGVGRVRYHFDRDCQIERGVTR